MQCNQLTLPWWAKQIWKIRGNPSMMKARRFDLEIQISGFISKFIYFMQNLH